MRSGDRSPSSVTAAELGGFAYLAVVGTALAYTLWLRGIALLPVQDVSFLGLLSPVVAAAAGWAVLGQALTAGQVAGAALALASLVLAQRGPADVPRPGIVARRTSVSWAVRARTRRA